MSTPAGLRSILDSGPCGETKVLGYPAPAYEADHTSRTRGRPDRPASRHHISPPHHAPSYQSTHPLDVMKGRAAPAVRADARGGRWSALRLESQVRDRADYGRAAGQPERRTDRG
jgi:hypothetical protein